MNTLRLTFGCILLCAAIAAAAPETIYLKSGKTYTGTIVKADEKELTIETTAGVLSFPWRSLDERTVRKHNEELWKEMKAEEFRQKGYVEYKGKWMTPQTKQVLEMQEKGLERFEGKWMPTNEVAGIKLKRAEEEFRQKQIAKGMVEYKGKWYSPEEAEQMKEEDANKGLRLGMTSKAVIDKWGEPTDKKESQDFKAQQREMWIYSREEEDKEDRLVFEMGTLKEVYIGQEPSL